MSLRVRAVVALVLLVLFPIVVVVVAAGLLVGGIALAVETTAFLGGKVALLAIPLIWALVSSARDVMRARSSSQPVPGAELTRAAHPALWAELDGMAGQMGQQPVDRVVVLPHVNAFVTEATGRRELMVGLPLLATLDRAQLRAVLAHELGHFGEGHTRAGARAYRAAGVLRSTHGRLDHGLLRALVEWYLRLYLAVSMSVLRDHERQADEWSARLAGSEAAASVFPMLARLDVAWDHLDDAYLPLAAQARTTPSATEGLRRLLDGRRQDLDAATASALAAPSSRYDTHPPARERVERLRALATHVDVPDGRQPAWTLLGRGDASLLDVERELGHGEGQQGPPGSWDDAVREALLAGADRQAHLLLDQVVQQVPDAMRTPAWVLHAVHEGHGPALVRPVLRGDIPVERREAAGTEALGQLLGGLLLSRLAAQGLATITASWSGPAQFWLVGRDGSRTPWPFADEAMAVAEDRTRVAALVERLRSTGANLDVLVEGSADGPLQLGSSAEAALGAVLARPRIAKRRQPFDVVLYDDGVLLHPAPRSTTGFRAAVGNYFLHDSGRLNGLRVQALVDEVAGHPAAWAATAGAPTRWIPYGELRGSRKSGGGVKGRRIWLIRPDGTELALRFTSHTAEIGDAEVVLKRALG